ncbi:hypothetical protein PR202_gb12076 [Eleusine coracana subsp. coracana]|uniref:F-box domain-containing protein n=1 Tax=Eleusine coracana subsp. coracana TaxID=191504 RepID=A0AAV5EM32_ELECO|nr:hypothetical protein PR202_gb12076 [Eleusine coracana subsp. coracana]
MAPPRLAPPELTDELVERVLLHIPPTDPAGLLRAALVRKRWGRLIFSRRFRSRFTATSTAGTPWWVSSATSRTPTARTCPASSPPTPSPSGPPRADLRGWRALDARHGRVLLRDLVWGPYLDVWDPFTGDRRPLTATPPIQDRWSWNAAVLCAQYDACDHLVCRGGPFLVVVLGAVDANSMSVCFYSSDTARWSTPRRLARLPEHGIDVVPPVLIGNALYFGIDLSRSILKYDLNTRKPSLIHQPHGSFAHFSVIMAMGNERLRVARLVGSKLFLSSMLAGPHGETAWSPDRVIELNDLLPVCALPVSSDFVGYAQGFQVFFVGTNDGLYSYERYSGVVKKVCDGTGIHGVVPYITLYIPGSYSHSHMVYDLSELNVSVNNMEYGGYSISLRAAFTSSEASDGASSGA